VRFAGHKGAWLSRSRVALSGKFLGVSMLCVGVLAAAAYAYVLPRLGGDISSTCALPVSSPPAVKEGFSSLAPLDAEANKPTPPEGDGCMEIADVTGQEDTLYWLLSANLSDEAAVARICRTVAPVIEENLGSSFDGDTPLKPGLRYGMTLNRDGNFLRATIELSPAQVFHVVQETGGLRAWKEDVVLDFKRESLSIALDGNLVESVLKAKEGIDLASKLTKVFHWDINFVTDAVKGDVCKVVLERKYADDRPSGYGRILYAEYSGKKTGRKTAVLFNNTYYDRNGVELKKDFLRSPLNVLRRTSPFGPRVHPILGVVRNHNGVDYGAPSGTPVRSIARGVVTFAGWKGGLGRSVWIRHDNGYESRYGHLSRINVSQGQRVEQTKLIGLVGQTGIATGPHLDFQILVSGKHRNPEKVLRAKVGRPRTVEAALQHRFMNVTEECLQCLGTPMASRSHGDPTLAKLP